MTQCGRHGCWTDRWHDYFVGSQACPRHATADVLRRQVSLVREPTLLEGTASALHRALAMAGEALPLAGDMRPAAMRSRCIPIALCLCISSIRCLCCI